MRLPARGLVSGSLRMCRLLAGSKSLRLYLVMVALRRSGFLTTPSCSYRISWWRVEVRVCRIDHMLDRMWRLCVREPVSCI